MRRFLAVCRVKAVAGFVGVISCGAMAGSPTLSAEQQDMFSQLVVPGQVTVIKERDLTNQQRQLLRLGARPTGTKSFLELNVPDRTAALLDEAGKLVKNTQQVKGKISVKLSPIKKTPFEKFRFIGFVPEGPNPNGPWDRMSRLFSRADGSRIMLTEWDYKSAGGGIFKIEEYQNQRVHGRLATLALLRSDSGRSLWKLSWTTDTKDYELYVEDRSSAPAIPPQTVVQIISYGESLSD